MNVLVKLSMTVIDTFKQKKIYFIRIKFFGKNGKEIGFQRGEEGKT